MTTSGRCHRPRHPHTLRMTQGGSPKLLGQGLSSLLYVLTPELVLIGGGLSGASDYFLPAVWQEVEQRVQAASREGLTIRRCSLGNGAGRLGAARLALQRLAPSLG